MNFPESYTLVLSGGGAKGAYQIGVMKALKELGIIIDSVVGTSVGALNGALWVMNKIPEAEKLWLKMTLENIIQIPRSLMKNGRFHLTKENVSVFKEMRANINKKGGANTTPLRNIIKTLLDERQIRKSGVDFGLESFEVDKFRAIEAFLEDIPQGELENYLMASAAFPGFQLQKIEGHIALDGGLSDNIPFALATKRGYTNIIVVDVSGLGVNRRPKGEHHNIVYIKNSRTTGGVMDFHPKRAALNIRMGYLDTLKIFGKIQGVDLFLKKEKSLEKKLYKILLKDNVITQYENYLIPIGKNKINIESKIRAILPEKVRLHQNLVLALLECTVRSLNLETLVLYSWREILELIRNKCILIQKRENAYTQKKGFFAKLHAVISETPHIFHLNPVEYNKLMDFIVGNKEVNPRYTQTLSRFIPELVGAKIFLTVMKNFTV